MRKGVLAAMLSAFMCVVSMPLSAQNIFKRLDSLLTRNYHKANYDTAYVARPQYKWTIAARANVSGAVIETKGIENGLNYASRINAENKGTLSVGVGYQGIMLNLSLNPAQLAGKYHDFELNLNCYGRRFGFDVIYQDAKNFTGWYEEGNRGRTDLPEDILEVRTLNLNAYYAFNSRRFSYPAAFSQSYIQRRSAGSFLLAASAMVQRANLDLAEDQKLKTTNIGIGAGYGYNYVPHRGWLLHLSLLPTLIVWSNSSLTIGEKRTKQHYHFPEFIVTGRAAVVYNWSNKFLGASAVYNFTNIGDKDELAVYNSKWRARAFFGLRF